MTLPQIEGLLTNYAQKMLTGGRRMEVFFPLKSPVQSEFYIVKVSFLKRPVHLHSKGLFSQRSCT
jgi:hypothetical protein